MRGQGLVSRVEFAPGDQSLDQVRLIRAAVSAERTIITVRLRIRHALYSVVGEVISVVACETFLASALLLLFVTATHRRVLLVTVNVTLTTLVWSVASKD